MRINGNAYSIMGYAVQAMRREHYPKEAIDAYLADAKSGDYRNLVADSDNAIQELNRKVRREAGLE